MFRNIKVGWFEGDFQNCWKKISTFHLDYLSNEISYKKLWKITWFILCRCSRVIRYEFKTEYILHKVSPWKNIKPKCGSVFLCVKKNLILSNPGWMAMVYVRDTQYMTVHRKTTFDGRWPSMEKDIRLNNTNKNLRLTLLQ